MRCGLLLAAVLPWFVAALRAPLPVRHSSSSRRHHVIKMNHAVIVQNKGGGHGEIGYHLSQQLRNKGLAVTLLQDKAAKATALPFSKYFDLQKQGVRVEWGALDDPSFIQSAGACTHVFDNNSKSPEDAEVVLSLAKSSPDFRSYAFVSSAGMYTSKGLLTETDPVKESGQRQVELLLARELPGKWCSFRPQYIYGPLTNKRSYLDWFLARSSRNICMAVPGDGEQPVSVTHCEDVAALLASVVGKETEAGGEIFNCGTDKLTTYKKLAAAAARGLGKANALVASLEAGTKSSFPFRPNAEGFAVDVEKAKSKLGWPGATHDVLADLSGFYTRDFLDLGGDAGELDTSKDLLASASGLDYVSV